MIAVRWGSRRATVDADEGRERGYRLRRKRSHLETLLYPGGKSARVLIVEDQMLIAYDLQQMVLAAHGEIVGMARTGEQAVRVAKQLRPDVVLMDVHLAGLMDGIDAAEAVLKLPGVALIFVTSQSDDRLLRRAQDLGVRIIPKPVIPARLVATIREICAAPRGLMRCASSVWQIRSVPIRPIKRPLLRVHANKMLALFDRAAAFAAGTLQEALRLQIECRAAAEKLKEGRLRLQDARLVSAARRSRSRLRPVQSGC
jgi:CheY-like chemotaxis protein